MLYRTKPLLTELLSSLLGHRVVVKSNEVSI